MKKLMYGFILITLGAHAATNIIETQLAIIGSGIAGLSAGIQAMRCNIKPLIIEGNNPGGSLTKAGPISNWPGEENITGPQLVEKLRAHAEKSGCKFLSAHVEKIATKTSPFEIVTEDNGIVKAQTIIIATGTAPKKLCCPGEEEYWGKGVAICSMCDGPLFENKKVVVIGGGNSALWEALALNKFTEDIMIIDSNSSLSATESVQQRVRSKPCIKIVLNTHVDEILGNKSYVTGIRITNLATRKQSTIPIDGVFVAIGMDPQTAMVRNLVKTNAKGFVKVTNTTQTSVPGIFAAGNVCNTPYKQAIAAAGMGCMAAIDAENYLKHNARTKKSQSARIVAKNTNSPTIVDINQ